METLFLIVTEICRVFEFPGSVGYHLFRIYSMYLEVPGDGE